jgi:hypothetical protein
MAVNLDQTFESGGKPLLDLLDYCVRSVQMDPVFLCLVREYRLHPTAAKALAIYEVFCAPTALARISVAHALPPGNRRIESAVAVLRQQTRAADATLEQPRELRILPPLPPRYLFDFLVESLEHHAGSSLRKVRRKYNPRLSPIKNLPGGRMNAGQRMFVEKIWEPTLRPQLVSAGFWRVATVA